MFEKQYEEDKLEDRIAFFEKDGLRVTHRFTKAQINQGELEKLLQSFNAQNKKVGDNFLLVAHNEGIVVMER